MSAVRVTLGDVVFRDMEVPERMPAGGGEQRLNVQELVGGARVIDAMGLSKRPIEWTGRFRGPDAIDRARQVDDILAAGLPVRLTYSDFSYTVIVQHYHPDLEGSEFEVPYSITCVVSTVDEPDADPGVDQMVLADHAKIQSLGAKIAGVIKTIKADVAKVQGVISSVRSAEARFSNAFSSALSPITDLLLDLSASVGGVELFAIADRATISGVLSPLISVQLAVANGIIACEEVFSDTAEPAGSAPFARPSAMVDGLITQTWAMTQVADLYDLHNLTARMATNLVAIGAGGSVITVGSANLFELAARYYGDAAEWATIAKANGVTEPHLTGLRSLLIPPVSGRTGGVLKEAAGADAGLLIAIEYPSTGSSGSGDIDLDFDDPDKDIWIAGL